MFLCKGTIKNDKFLKFRNHYNILIGWWSNFFFFKSVLETSYFCGNHDTLQSINQSILLPANFWVSDTRLQLHVSVHSWFGLSDQNALMKVIYDWQQLCWRYTPCFAIHIHFSTDWVWFGWSFLFIQHLIWSEGMTFDPALCLDWFVFLSFEKTLSTFFSCFINLLINLISDLKWNWWIRADSQSLLSVLQGD